MGFKRFPHTATISWTSAGTVNQTTGALTNGTLNTLLIVCNAQPQSQRYMLGADGNEKKVQYSISTPLISASVVKKTAQVNMFGKNFALIDLLNYQLHSELEC